ncbi:hypothetical protein HDU83_002085, partial [Entophlyctis luteolus]
MTRADLTKFAAHAAGFSNSKQASLRSLFVVDFAKAEATNPQDLKHILDVVNEDLGTGGKGGTARLDRLVKSAVTLWMVNALNVLMQATADKVQMAGFCEFQASLLVSNGNIVEAIPVLEKGLPLIQARYGPFSSNALSTLNSMGNAYCLDGQVAKSDAVFQYWLANASQTFGPASKQAVTIKCYWGSALVACHEYKRSESLLTEAFSAAHQNFGSIDPVTLQANVTLGMLYLCLERVDEAFPRFIQMRKVENVAKNIVKGMSKISLLDKRVAEEAKTTVNAGTFSEGLIAFGQFLKGQYSTALPVLQDWLFVAATMRGESLMFTARAALGFCHFYLGNMKEAIDILADETALESSWTAHFYDVPIAYAFVLQKIGRAEEALAILQEPMTKPKRVSVLRFMILMKQTLCLVYNDLHKYQKFQAAFLELDNALIDVYGNGAKRQEYLQPGGFGNFQTMANCFLSTLQLVLRNGLTHRMQPRMCSTCHLQGKELYENLVVNFNQQFFGVNFFQLGWLDAADVEGVRDAFFLQIKYPGLVGTLKPYVRTMDEHGQDDVSDAWQVRATSAKGRHVVAVRTLPAGACVLALPRAHAVAVLDAHRKRVCAHTACLARPPLHPLACSRCPLAFYCSQDCRDKDVPFHSLICDQIRRIAGTKASTHQKSIVRLVLHILAQRHLDSLKLKSEAVNEAYDMGEHVLVPMRELSLGAADRSESQNRSESTVATADTTTWDFVQPPKADKIGHEWSQVALLQSHYSEWQQDVRNDWRKLTSLTASILPEPLTRDLVRDIREIDGPLVTTVQEALMHLISKVESNGFGLWVAKRDKRPAVSTLPTERNDGIGSEVSSNMSDNDHDDAQERDSRGACVGRALYPAASFFN